MSPASAEPWSLLTLIRTSAQDPILAPLVAEQEREVMDRYGIDDAGPVLSPGPRA